jgi:hypothetical protein
MLKYLFIYLFIYVFIYFMKKSFDNNLNLDNYIEWEENIV